MTGKLAARPRNCYVIPDGWVLLCHKASRPDLGFGIHSVSYWMGIGNHFPAVKLPRRESSYFHIGLITSLTIRGRHDRTNLPAISQLVHVLQFIFCYTVTKVTRNNVAHKEISQGTESTSCLNSAVRLEGYWTKVDRCYKDYKVVCQSSYIAVLLADTAKPYSVGPYHFNRALLTCQFYSISNIVFDSPVKVKHLGSTRLSSTPVL